MLATVQALRASGQSCEARSANAILFVFPIPPSADLRIGHTIELDPELLNQRQVAFNVSTQMAIEILLSDNNVHDLRLPFSHGISGLPSAERLRGA